MELKAIHLIRRLERIDRDLEELNNLQMGIREDREYAPRIIDPLMDESIRLKKLKSKILSLIIKNPPENLTSGPVKSTPQVEITVKSDKPAAVKTQDDKKKIQETEKSPEKSPSGANQEKQKKHNPYKFIFEQNN